MEVKVSIIIPCYNVEKYVARCVESALKQTLQEIEIIIINDGSTDTTQEIIEKLVVGDTQVLLVNKENEGLSCARNTGIRLAKGEYIQHLDGDDWLEIDACKELYEKAKENDLDMVICNFYRNFENGNYQEDIDFIWQDDKTYTNEEALKSFFSPTNRCFAVWNKLIRRTLYIGIYHPSHISMGEDLATMPKLIARAKRIGKINKSYLHYIQNPSSISRVGVGAKQIQLFWAYEEIETFFKENNLYDTYKEQISNLKINHLTNFILCRPLRHNDKYDLATEAFLELIKNENLESLPLNKKLYCKIQRMFPSKLTSFILLKALHIWVRVLRSEIIID